MVVRMARQRLALSATVLFAAAAAIGILFQLLFIGAFIFGDGDALDIHKDVGILVHLCYVLTFIAAFVAWWPNWRATAWPFALAVLGTVQAFLAGGGDDIGPWMHAFHAALVPIVFLIAVRVALRSKEALSLLRSSESHA